MSVNKKIEKKSPIVDVQEYLSKGGHVQADMAIEIIETIWKTVCLRVPFDILQRVDERVKERAALTRTAWILEAIQQKLKAEEKEEHYEQRD